MEHSTINPGLSFFRSSSSAVASSSSSAPPQLIPDDPHCQIPDGDPNLPPKETSTQLPKPKNGATGRVKKRAQRGPGVAQLERLRILEGIPGISGEIPTLHSIQIQLGPGVAQLERLRIQEGITRISGEIPTLHSIQIQLPPIYGTPVPRFSSVGGGWMNSSSPASGFYCLPGCHPGAAISPGTLAGLGSQSLLQEQYSLDRHRIATVGSAYQQGLPSNQSVLRVSEHCDLCASLQKGINTGEYLPIDLNTTPPVNQGVRSGCPVMEHEFFPHKDSSGW